MLRRRSALVLASVLLGAIAAAYAPSLSGPFTFDDRSAVAQRTDLNDVARVAAGVPASVLGRTRAVTDLTFALDRSLCGSEPLPFRITNLLIHLALTAVLVALGVELLRRSGVDRDAVAYTAAALWGLHPLGSEAVAYVSQRYESLSSLCYAGAILLALRSEAWRRPAVGHTLATGCVVLGLGAKGLTVTAFAVGALAAAVFPIDPTRTRWRSIALRFAPWAAASLAFVAGTVLRLDGPRSAGFAIPHVSPEAYWLAQGRVLLGYARLVFWPAGQTVDHDLAVRAGVDGASVVAWMCVVAMGALCGFAAIRRRGEAKPAVRVAAFGGLWFVLLLAPTSALPIADLLVEHRAYLASWGLVLSAVVLGDVALRRYVIPTRPRTVIATLLTSAALVGATAALVPRARLWADDVALWSDAVEKTPGYYRPHNNLAYALHTAGDREGATAQWRLAAALWPEPMLADALRDVRRIEELTAEGRRAEAAALVGEVRARMMPTPQVLLPLARAQIDMGDPRAAELSVGWILRLAGPSTEAFMTLGRAYLAQRRFDEAIAAAADALDISSGATPARSLRAQALSAAGRASDACAALAAADSESLELQHTARALGCGR